MKTIQDILDTDEDLILFWKDYSDSGRVTENCLSQWFMRDFTVDGVRYNCMEQYIMAEKARTFKDYEVEKKIMQTKSQKRIKDLGREVQNYNDMVWNKIRAQVSVKGNLEKFRQNEDLKRYLLGTDDCILVEASPYDKIWGVGLAADNDDILYPECWKGRNILGFVLMEVRDILKKEN